jgi:radical SAM superfamily enzyme YgiQ (UPF0313 family)
VNVHRHGPQVLFRDNKFQWKRLQNLIQLAKEGTGDGLDLSDTLSDGARMVLLDPRLRQQLIMALTEDNRLHIQVNQLHVDEFSLDQVLHKSVTWLVMAASAGGAMASAAA